MAATCRLTLPLAWLLAGLAPAMAGTVDTAECRRDLIVLESELSQAQAKLVKAQDGSRTDQCTTWREQIVAFKKAAATYRRCKTGTDRRVLSAQMDSQALDFQSAIDQMCKGR
jgi:multidrug resistance efflux pump